MSDNPAHMSFDSNRAENWRLDRFEHDLSDVRTDVKAGFKELNTSLAGLQAQISGLQVSLPLTYVTRVDLQERMAMVEKARREGEESQIRVLAGLQVTIRNIIVAAIAALASGLIALLVEVIRILSKAN